jgi:hypothetical protein
LLEDRTTPSAGLLEPPAAVYVNAAFTGDVGSDPDGTGPATAIGYDAFADLPQALAAVGDGGTVNVAAGSYSGGVNIARTVFVRGDGSASTFLTGAGAGTGLDIRGPAVAVSGLSVRGFGTGLVATGGSYLSLTDVGLTGNTVGGGVFNVTTLLFAGAADETFDVRPGYLARQGDQPLQYSGVHNLTVDGGGGNNRLVVYLNDISSADKVWLTGAAVARDTAPFLLWYRDTGGSLGGGLTVVLGDGPETTVVQGQMTGAPTTVYGGDGDNAFYVALTSYSAYAKLTLDGGSGSSSLAVFDLSGGASMRAVATVIGVGQVLTSYPGGASCTIAYQNLGQLLNDLPGTSPPTLGFAPQQTFPAVCDSVAVGDINGDGSPDLITANPQADSVSVLLNTTAPGAAVPSFAPQWTVDLGKDFSMVYGAGVAVADVNGDGKPDLTIAGDQPVAGQPGSIAGAVAVLLNTTAPGAAAPSFAAAQFFPAGVHPYSAAVADVNGDGKADLITANNGDSSVSVLLNTAAAGASTLSFTPQQSFPTGGHPNFVAAADLNGDGRPDLITANQSDSTVSVLLNTTASGATAPAFASPQTFAAGGLAVAAADINGDGKPDLVTCNGAVLLNTTAPGATTATFAPPQSFATGGSLWSVAVADVNGDGRLDVLVAAGPDQKVSVLLNTTAPGAAVSSFAQPQAFPTAGFDPSVAVADVNGDGKPDLITPNEFGGGGTVSVLLNTTG